jgi:phospholipid/cholesterol/gamma-HCH transport system substrate-binding protein
MDKTKLETTVGFFVLLGVLVFFVIIFFVSGIYFWREGYKVKAEFDYTAGLNKGASVRLAGVRVGEVNGVSLSYDNETQRPIAVVDMWIHEGVKIRNNARAYIFGTFALNETLIEIVQTDDVSRPLVRDGDTLQGVSPMPMEKIMEKGLEISKRLEEFGKSIDALLGDDQILDAARDTILDMSTLLKYMTRMVDEKGDKIDNVVNSMDTTVTRLANILEAIDTGEGTMGKLINDDSLHTELETFIHDLDTETKALIHEIKLHPWRLLKKDDTQEKNRKKFLGIF